MIIYNVTIQIEKESADEWLRWLMEEHIPEIVNTGCFTDTKVLKLLDTDESEGLTYAVQYFAENIQNYNSYSENFAHLMRQKSFDKWGNKFIAFRSLMEVVN
ncbi:MAG TPA: DUF4286 family protein [Ferruginibacter sp.]|nr:DUF4286 family protein [Ferruginibacter sp.]